MTSNEMTFFGGWVKKATLGKGAFGCVTLWNHQTMHEDITIKECCVQLSARNKQRWKEEIDMLTKNKHPNLVAVRKIPDGLEKALNSHEPCLGMEFCKLGDLRKLLNKPAHYTGLNEHAVLNILRDVANAICFLHSKKIIHRDLKPENILLSYADDKVVYKITDLGYAKHLDHSSVATSFVGTMKYVAPEIYTSNEGYTITADYWSFGNVIFECITGHRPFDFDKSFVDWHALVSEKKSDDICGYEVDGTVEYLTELPSPNKISRPLKPIFEEWLRLTLEWDSTLRGGEKDETGLRRCFRTIEKILNTKVVHVFCVNDCKLVTFAIEETSTVKDLQDKISKECSLQPDELFLPNGETPSSKGSILDWYNQPGDSEWLIYSINTEVLLKPRRKTHSCHNNAKAIPICVQRMMSTPKQPRGRSEVKKLWGHSVCFCNQLAKNYRRLLQGQRAFMITLRNCNSTLMQEKEAMTAEAHKLTANIKMFIESCEYDLQLFKQTGFNRNPANYRYREEILQMIEEAKKYQENFIEELSRKITKAQRELVDLKNSSLVANTETELDRSAKRAREYYEKLERLEESRASDCTYMTNIIQQVLLDLDRLENDFYTHLRKVTLCKCTLQDLLPDILKVVSMLQGYRESLDKMMKRKQELTWKSLTLGTTSSTSIASDYGSMTSTLSSLIETVEEEPLDSLSVMKENEENLDRLGNILKSFNSSSNLKIYPFGLSRRVRADAVLTTLAEETVTDLNTWQKRRTVSEPVDLNLK